MLVALAQAPPKAIIGGGGRNFASAERRSAINVPKATDLLGLYVRFFLGLGFLPAHALTFAKARLRLKRRKHYTEDTLDFSLWNPQSLSPRGARPEERREAR
jgi:hypothetical protein